jgi:hypothetical protein
MGFNSGFKGLKTSNRLNRSFRVITLKDRDYVFLADPTARGCPKHVELYLSESNKPVINPLNAELNPIYHLLASLGAHPVLHISRIRVNCCI